MESIQLPGTDEERGFGGTAIGEGPVYALGDVGGGLVEHDPLAAPGWWEWTWHKVLWGIDPSYDGPVLVRGRQINGPHKLRFDDRADELRIEANDDASPGGWRDWPSAIRLQAPGCYAYQVDGLGFSQVVVFDAIPSPDSVGSHSPITVTFRLVLAGRVPEAEGFSLLTRVSRGGNWPSGPVPTPYCGPAALGSETGRSCEAGVTYVLAELRVPAGATVHYQYTRHTLGGEGEVFRSETRTFDIDTLVEEHYAFQGE